MHVLVAPIGEAPAVVTEAIDELAREGIPIRKVVVLFTIPMKPFYNLLAIDVKHGVYRGRIELEGVQLNIEDVNSAEDIIYFRKKLVEVVENEKREGSVHLLISGGRKTMALDVGLVALACGLSEVYHVKPPARGFMKGKTLAELYPLEDFVEGGVPEDVMVKVSEVCHPKPRDVRLIRIPLPKLSEEESLKLKCSITS